MRPDNVSQEQLAFIKQHTREKICIQLYRVILLIVLLSIWELAAQLKWIDPFIFSSPSRIGKTFFEMAKTGHIFYHIIITLIETLISFLLGTFLGLVIAVILWWFEQVSKTLEPYLVVLNSLPKTALAPIFIVWLGNNVKSILFTAVSVSIIVTVLSIYNSFIQVDSEKIMLIRTFGGSKNDILRKVILPSNYANMISVMKVNIGLSFIGVIIGEFLAAKAGLGYLIVYGSQVFKLDWVMMSVMILALLATLLYEGIVFIQNRMSRKNG